MNERNDHHSALAEPALPHLRCADGIHQLVVDGEPYLALGGELHNSSASSPEYMAPVWERLADNGVRTVISVASWQLVEPEEGRLDFSAVDDQIRQAERLGIRLVLIWFGAFKNAESTYAPSWVRRDEARFPRAERSAGKPLEGRFVVDAPILSVFSEELVQADAQAFASLMSHLAEVDPAHTVIAVQVQNEVGLLGDSRDRSALADAAWAAEVPSELVDGLVARGGDLHPRVRELWDSAGGATSGTWEEVFGRTRAAEEVFMAWGFSRYVDRVTAAGTAAHRLPAFTNAWLGPQPGAQIPGQYPSGGPVAHMLDVWQIGAPSLAFLSPDIYIDEFESTLDQYAVKGNAVFVPEARPDPALAFVALGAYKAIGFHPFAIESVPADSPLFDAYAVLNEMTPIILDAQAGNRIHGFRIRTGEVQHVTMGGFDIAVSGPMDTRGFFGSGTGESAEDLVGYGLIMQVSEDDFLVVARHVSLTFTRPDCIVEIDSLREGAYRNGEWVPRRTLNGDERHFMFRGDALATVRMSLLRRPQGPLA